MGPNSQTGLAIAAEMPKLRQYASTLTFDDIKLWILQNGAVAVLPMWNSHKGEVRKSLALQMLFKEGAQLHMLWPSKIEFHALVRNAGFKGKLKTITSVHVAQEQCSEFIKSHGAKLIIKDSTVEAYEWFKRECGIDGALCAPGQNVDGFPVLTKKGANRRNVTTFGLVGPSASRAWKRREWGALHKRVARRVVGYFGIQMPLVTASAALNQDDFFDELTADADTVDEIPKILFITRREEEDSCGLVMETRVDFPPPQLVSMEVSSGDIKILDDMGGSVFRYHDRLRTFLAKSDLKRGDFFRFNVQGACFYACPILGMITHGYESNIVEPVVRRIIARYFRLFDKGVKCTRRQRNFFKRYLADFYRKGHEFVSFTDLD